jgi:hypothetical protein
VEEWIYRRVRVHLDDLEEIVERLRGAELSVRFSDPTYQYDTIEELKETRGPRPTKLLIQGTRSSTESGVDSAAVTFTGNEARLTCWLYASLIILALAAFRRSILILAEAGVFLGVFLISVLRHRSGGVWLRRKHEGGFWKRNSDKILLLLLGALVGLFLSVLVRVLFKDLRPW